MEVYHKKFTDDPDLQGCQATINFIRRINNLIEAMTSRSSMNALTPKSKAAQVIIILLQGPSYVYFKMNNSFIFLQTIKDFIEFLQTWESTAKKSTEYLSSSTSVGLHVTLAATLEVMKFLTEECGYNFLMTARLNQDALEVGQLSLNKCFDV